MSYCISLPFLWRCMATQCLHHKAKWGEWQATCTGNSSIGITYQSTLYSWVIVKVRGGHGGYSIHSIDEVWSQLPGGMDMKAPDSITALSSMPVRMLTSRNLHLTFQASIWSQVTKLEKEIPDKGNHCTWNLLVSVHVKYKMKTEMKKERDWGREKLLSMQGDGDGHWLPCGT